MARSNITFLGFQSDAVVKDYMQRAKALIYAAEEDFGIVPVEAQACGTPVIAYGKGGVLETVINGETGLFYSDQTADAISDAITEFSRLPKFDGMKIRQNAEKFSKNRFKLEIKKFVQAKANQHFNKTPNS